MIHTQIIHLEVKGKTPSKSSAASSCVIERKVYKTNLVVDLLHIRVIIIPIWFEIECRNYRCVFVSSHV